MKNINLLFLIATLSLLISCGSDDDTVVVIDTQNPTAPLNLIITNSTDDSWQISWDAATDNTGVTGYNVYLDGVLAQNSVSGTSATLVSLIPTTRYSVFVTALDAEGNESISSDTITCTFVGTITFKPNLSEMGLFKNDLAEMIPQDGVQLFELNSILFTDYASKLRHIRLPNCETMEYNNNSLLPQFPDNTLMAKTFYYNLDDGNPSLGKQIIETRVAIKINGLWEMGNYIWNQAQTEAVYDEAGLTLPVSYVDINGATQNIDYVVPNNDDCNTCHSKSNIITPIGPKLRNMNFTPSYTSTNQLDHFASIGLLDGVNTSNISELPDWTDASLDILDRGRAYIDINCAHCHQPGGAVMNFSLDFRLETPFEDTDIYANRGEIEARIQSTVPTYRMPQIGRTVVHNEGVTMLLEYLQAIED